MPTPWRSFGKRATRGLAGLARLTGLAGPVHFLCAAARIWLYSKGKKGDVCVDSPPAEATVVTMVTVVSRFSARLRGVAEGTWLTGEPRDHGYHGDHGDLDRPRRQRTQRPRLPW